MTTKVLKVRITRGPFSGEKVYRLFADGKYGYQGMCHPQYLWNKDGVVLGHDDPPEGTEIEGFVACRVLEMEGSLARIDIATPNQGETVILSVPEEWILDKPKVETKAAKAVRNALLEGKKSKEDLERLQTLTGQLTFLLLLSLEEIKTHNSQYDYETPSRFIKTAEELLKENKLIKICPACGNPKIPNTRCNNDRAEGSGSCCFGNNGRCCRCGNHYSSLNT